MSRRDLTPPYTLVHTPADKPDLPELSAEHLARLAVENGEGGAQQLIDDPILYQSMVANVRKQMQRLEAWARADERRKARAELIAEMVPEAWLHTMDNTDGIPGNEPHEVVTFDDHHPFGRPGVDYSETYPVTSQPLAIIPDTKE